jgi:hypothetical protein
MQRRELIFINLARIVQQAANQGTFAVIDAAAGQKTQQAFVLLRVQVSFYAAFIGNLLGNGRSWRLLRNTLTFLQLHGAGLVAVNHAPLTFAGGRYQHLFNNLRQRLRLDSTAPVSGQQPRVRKRTIRFSITSPGCRSIRSSSIIISMPSRSSTGRSAARYSGTISIFSR